MTYNLCVSKPLKCVSVCERHSPAPVELTPFPQTSRWQNKQRQDKREAMVRLLLSKQCLNTWQAAIISPIHPSIQLPFSPSIHPSISPTIQLPAHLSSAHKSSPSIDLSRCNGKSYTRLTVKLHYFD